MTIITTTRPTPTPIPMMDESDGASVSIGNAVEPDEDGPVRVVVLGVFPVERAVFLVDFVVLGVVLLGVVLLVEEVDVVLLVVVVVVVVEVVVVLVCGVVVLVVLIGVPQVSQQPSLLAVLYNSQRLLLQFEK